MNEKIAAREIEKYYLCVVSGRPRPPEGTLEGFIFKDAAKNRVYVRKKRSPARARRVTHYRTLASRGGLSLVECRLGTGRTHQIRAQMAAAGDAPAGRRQVRRRQAQPGRGRERAAAVLVPY